jgi:hypothetical protein
MLSIEHYEMRGVPRFGLERGVTMVTRDTLSIAELTNAKSHRCASPTTHGSTSAGV